VPKSPPDRRQRGSQIELAQDHRRRGRGRRRHHQAAGRHGIPTGPSTTDAGVHSGRSLWDEQVSEFPCPGPYRLRDPRRGCARQPCRPRTRHSAAVWRPRARVACPRRQGSRCSARVTSTGGSRYWTKSWWPSPRVRCTTLR